MFKWFYKAIASGIKKEIDKEYFKSMIIECLNDEETQKFIIEFTDSLYARYAQKVMGSLGKMSASGVNVGESMPSIMNSKGQINLKSLIPMFLSNFMNKKTESPTGSTF